MRWYVKRTKVEQALLVLVYALMFGAVLLKSQKIISQNTMYLGVLLAAVGFFLLTARAAYREKEQVKLALALALALISVIAAVLFFLQGGL